MDALDVRGKHPCYPSDNNRRKERSKASLEKVVEIWEWPPAGWAKVNFDGSFVPQIGEGGLNVVIRNSKGAVLAIGMESTPAFFLAPWKRRRWRVEGLRIAVLHAHGLIILESDCARVVRAIQMVEDRLEISFLVVEAIEHTQVLRDWKVVQVKRESET